MNRRHALCCTGALAAGLFTSLASRTAPAHEPAAQDLVDEAFEGLDPARLRDVHAHLLGTGDGGSGCSIHPSLQQWWHPVETLRRRVILAAAGVAADRASVDAAYVQRLRSLAEGFPAGARWWLYAFDQACDDAGRPRPDWSTFHVPDAHAARVAAACERFEWVASIHPRREDALARLESAIAGGAVAVKWLPSAMNIDPADPRCMPFYERLARARLPLVVHGGEEKAVPGAGRPAFGNPLRLRAALDAGVPVIVAHAASLGHAEDLDRRSRPEVPAFDLFARLLGEGRGPLLADISAVFQANREPRVWRALLERDHWHGQLLNGSDYPLPGVPLLVSLPRLVRAGLLREAALAPLEALRTHNPLLFDFVLKRQLCAGSCRLPAAVFEARALPATLRSA